MACLTFVPVAGALAKGAGLGKALKSPNLFHAKPVKACWHLVQALHVHDRYCRLVANFAKCDGSLVIGINGYAGSYRAGHA